MFDYKRNFKTLWDEICCGAAKNDQMQFTDANPKLS